MLLLSPYYDKEPRGAGCHHPPASVPIPSPAPSPPCRWVTEPYLPPPRCPQGRCPGRGSSAPRCGRRGSPSPSRARTPSRPRWRSRRSSPARSRGAELQQGGHQSREAPSSCRDGCTPTPTPPSAPIGTMAGERAMPSRAAPACSETISAGLKQNSSWTPPGSLGLVFSLLVWEAAFPT